MKSTRKVYTEERLLKGLKSNNLCYDDLNMYYKFDGVCLTKTDDGGFTKGKNKNVSHLVDALIRFTALPNGTYEAIGKIKQLTLAEVSGYFNRKEIPEHIPPIDIISHKGASAYIKIPEINGNVITKLNKRDAVLGGSAYQTDGIILKIKHSVQQTHKHYFDDRIAVKKEGEMGIAYIKEIKHYKGPTGKACSMIYFDEAVPLNNKQISKITGHNPDGIAKNELNEGDCIIITLKGNAIPVFKEKKYNDV